MATDHDLDALKKRLRGRLHDGADVSLPAADLRSVLDELGRLAQSNDRLRRQNRRLRLKLQRRGLDGAGDAGGEGAAAGAGEDPLP